MRSAVVLHFFGGDGRFGGVDSWFVEGSFTGFTGNSSLISQIAFVSSHFCCSFVSCSTCSVLIGTKKWLSQGYWISAAKKRRKTHRLFWGQPTITSKKVTQKHSKPFPKLKAFQNLTSKLKPISLTVAVCVCFHSHPQSDLLFGTTFLVLQRSGVGLCLSIFYYYELL